MLDLVGWCIEKILPELALLCTVAGVVGWHVTHANYWWSQPLFQFHGRQPFSDRRHIFSWLSYWPICCWVMYLRIGLPWDSVFAALYWACVAIVFKAVWTLGKAAAGKHWPWIGVQLWRSVRCE